MCYDTKCKINEESNHVEQTSNTIRSKQKKICQPLAIVQKNREIETKY